MHDGRDTHQPYPCGTARHHAGNDAPPVAGNDAQPVAIGVAHSFPDLLAQAITCSVARSLTCVFPGAPIHPHALRPPDGGR